MLEGYKAELIQCLNQLPTKEVEHYAERILAAIDRNGTVFILGNGGSAATASHFQCDLGKGAQIEGKKRIKALSLTDNISIMSAISNDLSYDDVFVYQLENLMRPEDLLIAISASGNSLNVVKAMEYAKSIHAETFALVGFQGGKMKDMADGVIHIPSNNYGIVEDIHLVLGHMVSQYIRSKREEK